MPTNPYDFILYSYAQISTTAATADGSFPQILEANGNNNVSSYYDADTSAAIQPNDSPFTTIGNTLSPISLAQGSFAKLVSTTNYEYITTMIGGQVTFNKTVLIDDIKIQSASNGSSTLSAPGILVLKVYSVVLGNNETSGQLNANQYALTGVVDRLVSSTNGKKYFDFNFGSFVLLDTNANPIAIFDDSSPFEFGPLIGKTISVSGVVFNTLWDTRIPVNYYRTNSPVFQASANFNTITIPLTPDNSPNVYNNSNFLVSIDGLPLGNQQSVTASWTFNIISTTSSISSNTNSSAISFSDINNINGIQYGIMSQFTGLTLNQNGEDPDNAIYEQTYVSPSFSGYFLNYNDYVNSIGSKLSTSGDANSIDTLTNPILTTPAVGTPVLNTVLNFFSPTYGFISFSILPNMQFYLTGSGKSVEIIRPNNNGISLEIQGDSYAGLVFYGSNQNKIVDKPTRLVVDFTYATTSQQTRKKIIEIEDGGYANWVDAQNPDTIQDASVFFITGNQFKYTHNGYDQAQNQYSDNGIQTNAVSGQFYNLSPTDGSEPVFFTDPSQNNLVTISDLQGQAGPPQRYRRTQILNNTTSLYETESTNALQNGYLNVSPEKISYIQFDLSDFPVDTVINNGVLEIYFASGFTIKQGKDTNFILNKNIAWEKSRLSGNGKTYKKTFTDPVRGTYSVLQPMGNVHWRKNFFEIIIPYAFNSEPNDTNYGIQNLFSNFNSNTTPAPINPQPNLEYLGFINIDEINTATLTTTNFIENTVGLANVILSTSSIIYQIDGILSFGISPSGQTTLLNPLSTEIVENSTSLYTHEIIYALDGVTQIGTLIDQSDVLPNMKTLIIPYGLSETYDATSLKQLQQNGQITLFYGYVKSLLPASLIGFANSDIAVYQKALNYVQPLYSEYVVKLLEADTYYPFSTFSSSNSINPIDDISY